MSKKDIEAVSTLYILIVLTIALTLIFLAWVDADAAGVTQVYLPMVQRSDSYFKIVDADCNYVYVEAVNYPVPLSTDYYAGSVSILKYGTGIPVFTNLHYWPEASTENVKRYYAPSEGYFEVGVVYGLDAWVKCYGGQCWADNGDQLWMPCKPHKE